jgi:hypothetical protein
MQAAPVPTGLARFDLATAMAQSLACSLDGRSFPVLGGAWWHPAAAALVNRLPVALRDWFYIMGGHYEAVPGHRAGEISAERIAAWLASRYPPKPAPAIAIGSSNGAFVHWCAAAGVPWLPQTVLTVVRHRGIDPDDPQQALAADNAIGDTVAKANPDVDVHHLHDPNQDRLMLRAMAYFRLKYRVLPPAYADFIRRNLAPGGTIIICDCSARWPTTRLDTRRVFQFGAFGGLDPDEYFTTNDRVRQYLHRYRSPHDAWKPPAPNGESPEAEWGFEPALVADVASIAHELRARVLRVSFDHPEALSIPVAESYRAWYREQGFTADQLLAETFILMEPQLALQLRLVPLWLVFNTEPSAGTLERYLDHAPPFDSIDLTLFSHGTLGAGVTPIATWQRLIGRAAERGSLLGVDPELYPRDFAALVRYHAALRCRGAGAPAPPPLALDHAVGLLRELGPRYGVRCEAAKPPLQHAG